MGLNQKKENSQDLERKCRYCSRIFNPEAEGRIFTYILGEGERTFISSFCSDKCDNLYEIADKEAEERVAIQRMIKDIPEKLLSFKTDREHLIEKNIDKSLFITGGVGTGKSVFAANFSKAIAERFQVPIKWINYTSFLFDLKKMFNTSEDPYNRVQRIAESKILVIDDFGTEKNSEFIQEITYYLINERELNTRRTIITSNLDLDEFEGRIGSRIAGLCYRLKFSGEDRRIKR